VSQIPILVLLQASHVPVKPLHTGQQWCQAGKFPSMALSMAAGFQFLELTVVALWFTLVLHIDQKPEQTETCMAAGLAVESTSRGSRLLVDSTLTAFLKPLRGSLSC